MECPVCAGMITEGMSNCRECGYTLGEPVGKKNITENQSEYKSTSYNPKVKEYDELMLYSQIILSFLGILALIMAVAINYIEIPRFSAGDNTTYFTVTFTLHSFIFLFSAMTNSFWLRFLSISFWFYLIISQIISGTANITNSIMLIVASVLLYKMFRYSSKNSIPKHKYVFWDNGSSYEKLMFHSRVLLFLVGFLHLSLSIAMYNGLIPTTLGTEATNWELGGIVVVALLFILGASLKSFWFRFICISLFTADVFYSNIIANSANILSFALIAVGTRLLYKMWIYRNIKSEKLLSD